MTRQHSFRINLARTVSLTLVLIATFAYAQSETHTPPFNGIAHVAIRVHDLAASVAFYQKLGFEQAFDLRKDNVPYESFIKVNDNQFIELYPVTSKDPTPGFLHLCFEGVDLNTIFDDYASHGLTPTAVRKAGAGNRHQGTGWPRLGIEVRDRRSDCEPVRPRCLLDTGLDCDGSRPACRGRIDLNLGRGAGRAVHGD